jgi:hypothetical protein
LKLKAAISFVELHAPNQFTQKVEPTEKEGNALIFQQLVIDGAHFTHIQTNMGKFL